MEAEAHTDQGEASSSEWGFIGFRLSPFAESPPSVTDTDLANQGGRGCGRRGFLCLSVCELAHAHRRVGLGPGPAGRPALCRGLSVLLPPPLLDSSQQLYDPGVGMSLPDSKMGSDGKLASRLVVGSKCPDPQLFPAAEIQRGLHLPSPVDTPAWGPPHPRPGELDPRERLLAPLKSPSPSPTGSRAAFTGKIIRNLILISPTPLIVCGQFDCNSRH